MAAQDNLNPQQFYHGTTADLEPGALISPGGTPNHARSDPGAVYMTEHPEHAQNWAAVASRKAEYSWMMDRPGTRKFPAHVYQVEPTGPVEPDGNTDSRVWPGSYQSAHPLRVLGRVTH